MPKKIKTPYQRKLVTVEIIPAKWEGQKDKVVIKDSPWAEGLK